MHSAKEHYAPDRCTCDDGKCDHITLVDDRAGEFESLPVSNMVMAGCSQPYDIQLQFEKTISEIVHELRNPLCAVLTASSQLAEKTDDVWTDSDRYLAGIIAGEAARLEKALTGLVEIAKPLKMELSPVSIVGALRQIASATMQRDSCRSRGIDIQLQPADEETFFHADLEQLCSALKYLLDGVVRSAYEGTRVVITLRDSTTSLKIEMRYQGVPIRPELLRKVLLPFTSTRDGGSGLELALAQKVVTAHGGTIGMKSSKKNPALIIEFPKTRTNAATKQ